MCNTDPVVQLDGLQKKFERLINKKIEDLQQKVTQQDIRIKYLEQKIRLILDNLMLLAKLNTI